jgi:hypothetical protein
MRDHPGASLIVATLLAAATTTPVMAADADLRLATDEVAPGVQRVLGDGVHKVDGHWVATGRDGSVWLAEARRYTELGGETVLEWGPGRSSGVLFDVAPDGTVWVVEDTPGKPVVKIRSFDGDRWTTHRKARADSVEGWAIDIGADGTVWAAWPDGESRDPQRASVVATLTVDGWRMLERTLPGRELTDLIVTDDGDVWALQLAGPPLHYTDGEWRPPMVSDVVAGDEGFAELTLTDDLGGSVGRDGTVWLIHRGLPGPMDALGSTDAILRFDGEGWTGWSLPAELTELGRPTVAPDGSAWIPDDWPNGRPGLYRFDGSELKGFLPGRSVYGDPLVATDGSAWVVARSRERPRSRETWRITPQAIGSTP